MQFSLIIASAFASTVLAAPTSIVQRDLTYGPSNHVINAVCPAPQGTKPLGALFPFSSMLGTFIAPTLRALIGEDAVEHIDKAADDLCIGTAQDEGACQEAFAAVRAFIDAKTPLSQSQEYGCLLNYLCIAHINALNQGTCNFLLAGADCNANRIIGAKDLECTS